MKAKVQNILVTSQARGITIENARKILASIKKIDPDAVVDLVIYHVKQERDPSGDICDKYDKLDAENPEGYNPAPALFPE